jgi:GDP-L-fucose synthase
MWNAPPFQGYFGYGWMRRYLERLGEFVHGQSEMKVALVRPTAIFGRRDNFNPESSHVIPALIRRALAKENPFEVWGSADVVRDFLHVSDLARGCLLILEKYAVCDPVNIGYGQGVTIKEIVHFILEKAGHENAKVVFNTSKPTTIPIRLVDTSKSKEVLGFEPKIRLKDGIRDTVDWYVKTQWKADE